MIVVKLLSNEIAEDVLMGNNSYRVVSLPIIVQHSLQLIRPLLQLLVRFIEHAFVDQRTDVFLLFMHGQP